MPRPNLERLLTMTTLLAAVPALAQTPLALRAPEAGDLASPLTLRSDVAGRVATPARPATGPAHYAWPLSPRAELDATPAPFVATSREYWTNATARDLVRGLDLPVEAPGALVRIQPAPGSGATPIAPVDLSIRDDAGRTHSAAEALELMVSAEAMAASAAPFPPGTSAFQIAPALGAGILRLTLRRPLAADDRYVIHVFDRASRLSGAARTVQPSVHAGGRLGIEAGLLDGDSLVAALVVEGFAAAPDGRTVPLRFSREEDRFRATLALPPDVGNEPGLWEIVAFVEGRHEGRKVLRTVRTAFGVALPTAALDPDARLEPGDGIRLEIPVRAAATGRYEIRGVLYGTDADGELRPLAVAHAADDLDPGRGRLTLDFGPELIERSGLRAPFELRDLELRDQGRLGLLHRQRRALEIGG